MTLHSFKLNSLLAACAISSLYSMENDPHTLALKLRSATASFSPITYKSAAEKVITCAQNDQKTIPELRRGLTLFPDFAGHGASLGAAALCNDGTGAAISLLTAATSVASIKKRFTREEAEKAYLIRICVPLLLNSCSLVDIASSQSLTTALVKTFCLGARLAPCIREALIDNQRLELMDKLNEIEADYQEEHPIQSMFATVSSRLFSSNPSSESMRPVRNFLEENLLTRIPSGSSEEDAFRRFWFGRTMRPIRNFIEENYSF